MPPIATYTMAAIFPGGGVVRPDNGQVGRVTNEQFYFAFNQLTRIRDQFLDVTNGKADLRTTILIDENELGADANIYRGDGVQFNLRPSRVAAHMDIDNPREFDIYGIFVSPTFQRMNTYTAIAYPEGFTTKIDTGSDDRMNRVVIHEIAHYLEYRLRPVVGEGWPTCPTGNSGENSIHCGVEYGFEDDINWDWLKAWYGNPEFPLPDGKGMNDAKWAVNTPLENTGSFENRNRRYLFPWGRTLPPVV